MALNLDVARRCVGFVMTPTGHGAGARLGACFIGAFGGPDMPERRAFLATARHVVEDLDTITIRFNLRPQSGAQKGYWTAPGPKSAPELWLLPDSPTIDLAVYLRVPRQEVVDMIALPTSQFWTNGDVDQASEVVAVTPLPQHLQTNRNQPVLRWGHLSLVADEPLNVQGGPARLHLAELAAWPGNSGAPVFSTGAGSASNKWGLLGVLTGFLPEQMPSTGGAANPHHSGLATVEPADHLLSLLEAGKQHLASVN